MTNNDKNIFCLDTCIQRDNNTAIYQDELVSIRQTRDGDIQIWNQYRFGFNKWETVQESELKNLAN